MQSTTCQGEQRPGSETSWHARLLPNGEAYWWRIGPSKRMEVTKKWPGEVANEDLSANNVPLTPRSAEREERAGADAALYSEEMLQCLAKLSRSPTEAHKEFNDDGAAVWIGNDRDADIQGGDGTGKYYCGRYFGQHVLVSSDGFCGPFGGPQCLSCRRFQTNIRKLMDKPPADADARVSDDDSQATPRTPRTRAWAKSPPKSKQEESGIVQETSEPTAAKLSSVMSLSSLFAAFSCMQSPEVSCAIEAELAPSEPDADEPVLSDVPSHRSGPKPNSGDQLEIPCDVEAELGIVNLGTANFDPFSMAAEASARADGGQEESSEVEVPADRPVETGSPARSRTNSWLSTESGRSAPSGAGCHQRLHAAKHKVQSRTEAADRPGNGSVGATPVLSSASTISTAVCSSQGHVQPRQQNRLKELAFIADNAHAAERAAPLALVEAEQPQQRTPAYFLPLADLREAEVLEDGPLIPKVVSRGASRERTQPEQQPAAEPVRQPPHGSAPTSITVPPLSLSEQIRELEAQPSFAPTPRSARGSLLAIKDDSRASVSSWLEPEVPFRTQRSTTSFLEPEVPMSACSALETPRKRFNKMQTPVITPRSSGQGV